MLLPFGEMTVLAHVYEQLKGTDVDEIIIVTGSDEDVVRKLLHIREQDQTVHNTHFEKGLTSSIQKGLEIAEHDAYMICLGDMPLITTKAYQGLINNYKKVIGLDSETIFRPLVNKVMGNPVIFTAHYYDELMAVTEPDGCKSVIEKNKQHLMMLQSKEKAFISDMDTPTDYQNMLKDAF